MIFLLQGWSSGRQKEESATIAFSQNDNLQITLIYIDRNYQFVEPKSFIILVSHYLWRDKYMVTFNKTCYTATLTVQSDVATIIARIDDLFSLMDPHWKEMLLELTLTSCKLDHRSYPFMWRGKTTNNIWLYDNTYSNALYSADPYIYISTPY